MSASPTMRLFALAVTALWLEAPAAYFSEADWKLVREAVRSVVESEASDSTQHWSNPANGHSGVVSSLKAFESKEGRRCRVLRLDNRAQGLSGSMRYTLCRDEAGVWRDVDSGVPFTEVAATERSQ